MAETKKLVSRKAKILICLLLFFIVLMRGFQAFPYIWPYPSNLKFAATSEYHNIIVTGKMLPSKDLRSISKFKIDRIIKNTSGASLSKNQIIALRAPHDRSTSMMRLVTAWESYFLYPRQHKGVGDHGLLYAEGEIIQNADKKEEYVFRRLAFQSDNIVKRMLLNHYKELPQLNRLPRGHVRLFP